MTFTELVAEGDQAVIAPPTAKSPSARPIRVPRRSRSGVGETISAAEGPVVGNLEVATSVNSARYVYGGQDGDYIDASTRLGWSGLTLDDLAAGEFAGIFSGARMGGKALECKGYHVTRRLQGITATEAICSLFPLITSRTRRIGPPAQCTIPHRA